VLNDEQKDILRFAANIGVALMRAAKDYDEPTRGYMRYTGRCYLMAAKQLWCLFKHKRIWVGPTTAMPTRQGDGAGAPEIAGAATETQPDVMVKPSTPS
jgi:hypothetical protein